MYSWLRNNVLLAADEFANQTDINVGVFFNPHHLPQDWQSWLWDERNIRINRIQNENNEWISITATMPTNEQRSEAKAEARPILEARLNAQIQSFINLLRDKGIVQ